MLRPCKRASVFDLTVSLRKNQYRGILRLRLQWRTRASRKRSLCSVCRSVTVNEADHLWIRPWCCRTPIAGAQRCGRRNLRGSTVRIQREEPMFPKSAEHKGRESCERFREHPLQRQLPKVWPKFSGVGSDPYAKHFEALFTEIKAPRSNPVLRQRKSAYLTLC